MSSEISPDFKIAKCQDFCNRVADGTHDSPREAPVGKRLVTSKNVKSGRLELDSAYLISIEDFESINKRSKVDQWDLLLTMIGTVGEVCLVTESEPDFAIKNVGLLKCGDELKAKWLYYFLRSPQGQKLIEERKKGSTQQYVSLTELRKLPISYPDDPSVMRRIVENLTSIDDRITLLRETNTTLEAIAQALFKSWFVDFDPVHAKMQGRVPEGMDETTAALFPDSFEESELGPVPMGWKLVPFGQLLSHTIGGDWGSDVADEKNDTRVAIIRGTDIPDLQSNANSRVPVRYTSQKKLAGRKLEDGDLLLEVSGGSKDQPTGRSLYLSGALLSQFDCPVEPASFCRLLRPLNKEVGMLLAQHLTYIYAQGKTWEYQNQSTGIANFQTTHFLETELVACPPDDVLKAFAETAQPLIARAHLAQIQELASLRDTLLPRLISGQLRITEAQTEMESV
jgi:type I restriction enzyme S subunit